MQRVAARAKNACFMNESRNAMVSQNEINTITSATRARIGSTRRKIAHQMSNRMSDVSSVATSDVVQYLTSPSSSAPTRAAQRMRRMIDAVRSEEHTSELQSHSF